MYLDTFAVVKHGGRFLAETEKGLVELSSQSNYAVA